MEKINILGEYNIFWEILAVLFLILVLIFAKIKNDDGYDEGHDIWRLIERISSFLIIYFSFRGLFISPDYINNDLLLSFFNPVISGFLAVAFLFGLSSFINLPYVAKKEIKKIWDNEIKKFVDKKINDVTSGFEGKVLPELIKNIPVKEEEIDGITHKYMPAEIREAYYSTIYGKLLENEKSYLEDIEVNLASYLNDYRPLHSSRNMKIEIRELAEFAGICNKIIIEEKFVEKCLLEDNNSFNFKIKFNLRTGADGNNFLDSFKGNIEKFFSAKIQINSDEIINVVDFLDLKNGEIVLLDSVEGYTATKDKSTIEYKRDNSSRLKEQLKIGIEKDSTCQGIYVNFSLKCVRKKYSTTVNIVEESLLLKEDSFYSFNVPIPFNSGLFKITTYGNIIIDDYHFGNLWKEDKLNVSTAVNNNQELRLKKDKWSFLGGIEGVVIWKEKPRKLKKPS